MKAKKQCNLRFTKQSKNEIVVDLQSLLNKTAERLVNALGAIKPITCQKLKLYVSVGMDSASGYKNPNQKIEGTKINSCSQHLFQ